MCPKCQAAMRSYERNQITVDQCTGCQGIFLDRGELERLMEAEAAWYDARDYSGQGEAVPPQPGHPGQPAPTEPTRPIPQHPPAYQAPPAAPPQYGQPHSQPPGQPPTAPPPAPPGPYQQPHHQQPGQPPVAPPPAPAGPYGGHGQYGHPHQKRRKSFFDDFFDFG